MQLTYLVHHAVQLEVSEASGNLALEYIDEHDVHHGFHQDVRAVRTDIGQLLDPVGVVVVLLDLEF